MLDFQKALKGTVLPSVARSASMNNHPHQLLEHILTLCLYQYLAIHWSSLGHSNIHYLLLGHHHVHIPHHNLRVQKVQECARNFIYDYTLAQACSHRQNHSLHIQYRIGWMVYSMCHLGNKHVLAKTRMYRFVSICQSHP
jgi:hypothetical protein